MARIFSTNHSVFFLCMAILTSGCEGRQADPSHESQNPLMSDLMDSTPFMVDGIENPQFTAGAESELDPQTEVVGIVIDSSSFAFPLKTMSGMTDHVVNHVVEAANRRIPLTVTYCDMNNCIRAFSSDDASESLKISTLGRSKGELFLQYGELRFLQSASDLPLNDLEFERTTLQKWLESHPGSKVYLGRAKPE